MAVNKIYLILFKTVLKLSVSQLLGTLSVCLFRLWPVKKLALKHFKQKAFCFASEISEVLKSET
jgi:hypothetical protein